MNEIIFVILSRGSLSLSVVNRVYFGKWSRRRRRKKPTVDCNGNCDHTRIILIYIYTPFNHTIQIHMIQFDVMSNSIVYLFICLVWLLVLSCSWLVVRCACKLFFILRSLSSYQNSVSFHFYYFFFFVFSSILCFFSQFLLVLFRKIGCRFHFFLHIIRSYFFLFFSFFFSAVVVVSFYLNRKIHVFLWRVFFCSEYIQCIHRSSKSFFVSLHSLVALGFKIIEIFSDRTIEFFFFRPKCLLTSIQKNVSIHSQLFRWENTNTKLLRMEPTNQMESI